MAEKLTDKLVKSLAAPPTANRITYDDEVKGFGRRVTAAGTRAFILNYRTRGGRERRFTIGDAAHWKWMQRDRRQRISSVALITAKTRSKTCRLRAVRRRSRSCASASSKITFRKTTEHASGLPTRGRPLYPSGAQASQNRRCLVRRH